MGKPGIICGHAFSSRDMFMNFDGEKIGIQVPADCSERPTRYRQHLAAKVFAFAFVKMLDDVIDNNDVFQLPMKNESYIEIQKLGRDELATARKNGSFKDLDILRSSFYGAIVLFRYKNRSKFIHKQIIVDKRMKERIYNNLYNKRY